MWKRLKLSLNGMKRRNKTMLSDEEKQAIERLNKRYDFFKENPLATNVWLTLDIHNLRIVLNLIEKQSKEIEELKEKNKNLNWYFENQKDNFVHKDKIKAKIEEQEKIINTGGIDFNTKSYARCKIEFGQSLLRKE